MVPTLSSSPPILPIPRQPSPLSFSSVSIQEHPSPPESSTSHLPSASVLSSSPPSSRILPQPPVTEPSSLTASPQAVISPASSSRHGQTRLPVDPAPDSLLLRSTFHALEHSAVTLKRLSKAVLHSTQAYVALLQQVEKAEDEVFLRLGELARWLEAGYSLGGDSIWEDDTGIRKLRRDQRRKEREELEVMVEHGIRAVKGELKRNGLAGHGAQTRFENNAKIYYNQTADYLSPSTSTLPNPPPQSPGFHKSTEPKSSDNTSSKDLAQATRLSQFDLARYSHHSTLLYAVPPTSIPCLDLLVGLYSWAGGVLGEVPELRRQSFTRRGTELTVKDTPRMNELDTPGLMNARKEIDASPTTKVLKSTMSHSLSQLASIRTELLDAWAKRDQQTNELEEIATDRQTDMGLLSPDLSFATGPGELTSPPISSSGIEHRKARKMHKLHKSVGGKLRDLLSSSASSTSLANSERSERLSRASVDILLSRDPAARPPSLQATRSVVNSNALTTPVIESEATLKSPVMGPPPPVPVRRPSTTSPRPSLQPRHSMHATRIQEYVSPFIASQAVEDSLMIESSPDLRLSLQPLAGTATPGVRIGGVGGLGAGGDEDEKRELVGRKKEGVLWGAGVWEALSSRALSKNKWEKFWVVLDKSRIYEYRDNNLVHPESAHEVIDLKFASVRDGRGTDRRFVFEIVTPTQGRRLYQATSEQEMKQWLYAICNAIESCINQTSSVRTFDTSKLRNVSGSLDDHALPTRRLFPGVQRGLGLGLPLPTMSNTPGARRSMPPPARPSIITDPADRRQRKPSLKKVLRQSAEIAGEKWNHVLNHRNSSGFDLPRASFLAQAGRSSSGQTTMPSTAEEEVRPTSTPLEKSTTSQTTHTSQTTQSRISDRSSWCDEDGQDEIEKRVLEMAGLGIGASPGSTAIDRRAVSDIPPRTPSHRDTNAPTDMARTRSAEIPPHLAVKEQVDMKLLRKIADMPENSQCADCRRSMKSSRWATLSLRDVPMVMFLCIRCVGVHRSLGTHISKPRSVDLDIWTPESILLAQTWGNIRGNAIWEAERVDRDPPDDEFVGDFIRAKYVEGKWLAQNQRFIMGLQPANVEVGRAI